MKYYKTTYRVDGLTQEKRRMIIESLREISLMFSRENNRAYFHLPEDNFLKLYGDKEAMENFLEITSTKKNLQKDLEHKLNALGFIRN